ncbi:uncharacterized protein VICG_01959 [Vittaforma corneae ATCC 50505]|uniref:DNA-directed RNA polymerase II subunit RPB9-like zinc ribbon domain-containing protein n=1 Tax=Vittaforma corneae (strain ATCC 50505) TaxID=993615 RepID=L2GKG1_VITCO|nr:uncharacterized protein VICG_01959 [Vittaforma corneae ATCC 50505]ELA41000.1 hypothetical protein VICG_01959 [Vittaforma corneae ATCC 50505]
MDIQFCRDCNNLMSPKIESGNLLYICGKCETVSESDSPVISSIDFKKRHDSNASYKHDLVHDRTLPRLDIKCLRCGNTECLGYIEKNEERALNFYYVCTVCFNEWTD